MKKFLLFLSVMFFAIPVMACTSSEIDVLGDGTQCETVNFSIGTTNSTSTIKFSMTAIGTFYVDCGNGGTLNSNANDVTNNNTITRSNTTEVTYTCTWGATGTQTIRFAGTATGYSTSSTAGAINFFISPTMSNIASVSGNLSVMFPYITDNPANGAQPRFYQTFRGTRLTSVPDTLFANYTTAATYMFHQTFWSTTLTSIPENLFFPNATSVTGQHGMFQQTFNSCTKLTSVPENLFAKITTSAQYMFYGTFNGCTGLTSIPENLFFPNAVSVNGQANMFQSTFQGCTKLTSIPANLFAKVTTGASSMFRVTFYDCANLTSIPENLFFPNVASVSGRQYMFYGTFNGCIKLTSIPENLFAKVTTGAQYMFGTMFGRCSGLTSIPENLFFPNATSVTGQVNMFNSTFYLCTKLTSVPENLFAKVTTSANGMFSYTFQGCTNLGGYIPPSTFAGLIANNHPTTTNMWDTAFTGTQLVTSCPTGTTQYITGYEGSGTSTWNGKVSCVDEYLTCDAGEYLSAHGYECTQCPANSYCVGGTYNFNETTDQGIQSCNGGFSPAGSSSINSCYPHIMHVGNDIMYLKSTSRTIPSLNVQIGNEIFYANMETTQTYMSSDSPHYFRIQSGDNNYWVCDDTTCPEPEVLKK